MTLRKTRGSDLLSRSVIYPVLLFLLVPSFLLLFSAYNITAPSFSSGEAELPSHASTVVTHRLADATRTFSPNVERGQLPAGRLIVMTMNRANSLQRILTSLQEANYGTDRVDLDIWVDRVDSTAPSNLNVSRVIRDTSWKQGAKTVYMRRQPGGLYQQWMYTWDLDSPGDIAVILEDDLELSPAFYQWLKRAHSQYGDDPEVGAFTLQRTEIRPRKPPPRYYQGHLRIPRGTDIFKYRLAGSWGLAPKRETWRAFLRWFEAKRRAGERPYLEDHVFTTWYKRQERGHAIARTMWTSWFIKFVDERNIFTVTPYAPNRTTLSGCWKEPGLHFGKKSERTDFPIFQGKIDDFMWPRKLDKYDWDGTIIGTKN